MRGTLFLDPESSGAHTLRTSCRNPANAPFVRRWSHALSVRPSDATRVTGRVLADSNKSSLDWGPTRGFSFSGRWSPLIPRSGHVTSECLLLTVLYASLGRRGTGGDVDDGKCVRKCWALLLKSNLGSAKAESRCTALCLVALIGRPDCTSCEPPIDVCAGQLIALGILAPPTSHFPALFL